MTWIEWEQLPRKTISAAGLFFNTVGEILIVKPNYKDGWNIPGGTIDDEESPLKAFTREVMEEIGLEKRPHALLCIDYVQNMKNGHDHISMVFDGGELSETEMNNVHLQQEELTEYRFVSVQEAEQLLATNLAKRLPKCIEAHKSKKTIYLENGEEKF